MRARLRLAAIAGAVLGAVLAMRPGWAEVHLTPDTLGRLVVMADRTVDGIVARQVVGTTGGVVVGGDEADSGRPLIMLIDTGRPGMRALPSPASAYFALSPDGKNVAYWRSVATADGTVMGELVAYDLASGSATSLSPPQLLGGAGSLVWPLPSNIVYAAPRPQPDGRVGMVWRLDLGTARSFCLLTTGAGEAAGRVWPGPDSDNALYVSGTQGLEVPITGAPASSVLPDSILLRQPGGKDWLSLGALVELHSDKGTVASAELRATDAAWAPGGAAVLLAAGRKLCAAPADLSFLRELRGFAGKEHEFILPTWRSDLAEGAVGDLAGRSSVHLFTLGTETVEATLRFPMKEAPKVGTRMWLATDFRRLADGSMKPNWATLKGCFVVRSVERSSDGVVVQAENQGRQGGELNRLRDPQAKISEPSQITTTVGGRQIVWVQRFEVAARKDVSAWIYQMPALGKIEKIKVEKRRLDAP